MALPKFDFLSFIAGFAAASILWLLIWQGRANWPQIQAALRRQITSVRKKNLSDSEVYLNQSVYRRVQRQHLAAALFSLDEILIPPLVVAPPAALDSSGNRIEESELEQVIPYMPDWPEVASEFGFLTRPLSDIASGKADIALIGGPGIGKTTTLCDFATSIVQKRINDHRLLESHPIFLHVLDLKPLLLNNDDASDALVDGFTGNVAVTLQKQARTTVRLALREGRAILLLDGLDQLPPANLQIYTKYLSKLKSQHSNLQIIAACSDLFLNGLIGIGFTPVAVAPWNQTQLRQFIEKWGQAWKEWILPQVSKYINVPQPDSLALENWISTTGLFYSPFDWTELVWGSFSGDLSGNYPQHGYEAHLKRIFKGRNFAAYFGKLAATMLSSNRSNISFEQAASILNGFSNEISREVGTPTSTQINGNRNANSGRPDNTSESVAKTAGEKMIGKAIELGLLAEYGEDQIAFCHLPHAAYLAAINNQNEDVKVNWQWAFSALTEKYLAFINEDLVSINDLLALDADPLQKQLLLVGRILAVTPPNSKLRTQIMRRIMGEIQDEKLLFGTRARLLTACVISNDPSIVVLLRQWLNAPSNMLRRLAALGCGLLKDTKSVGDLTNLLSDADFRTHSTAGLALISIPGDAALHEVALALSHGVETLRHAVAEGLALQPGQAGIELLKDAAAMDDLLIRRAVVFGLAILRTPWSFEMLSKMAVEDAQWVVRNAAAQALEQLQQPDPNIPTPLAPFWKSSWLITFAGKHGLGVSPDEPPIKLLSLALESGTEEDCIMALQYLDLCDGAEAQTMVEKLITNRDEDLSEKALQSLWRFSVAGLA
ncbi:MAG TPA: HEAT repeat domain-containing protein [Longilinea sp.]|nr:HEAT repeat domain-containing protein [Longilinea sp.]